MTAKPWSLAAILLPGLILSACDGSGGADGPGAVSVDEARALDEAAKMLDERRLPEGALPMDAPQTEQAREEVGEETGE